MFLTLNHQRLDIYQTSKAFVYQCYKLTKLLPAEERFGMISQIRRAALSVHLNIAEGHPENQKQKEKDIVKLQEVPLLKLMPRWILLKIYYIWKI